MIRDHKPLQDPEIIEYLFAHLNHVCKYNVDLASWSTEEHIAVFENWINSNQISKIVGLENFPVKALCSGTSQTIENFVNRNNHRQIRFSRSEFVLSRIVCNANGIKWQYLEDHDLKENDALILSWPFSGNGGTYPNIEEVLTKCNDLNIPVLIDAAYFGIATSLEIDARYDCITDVCTSISKPFSTMLRHGIRFTKKRYDDSIQNSSDSGILSRMSTVTATHLLTNFPAEFIINKYQPRQEKICKEFGIVPTPVITLALGDCDRYKDFLRGDYVRICITDELQAT